MGYYINVVENNTLPVIGKAAKLVELGAVKIQTPKEFEEDLVFVNNPSGSFDAAMWVYSEEEFNYVKQTFPDKGTWLKLKDAKSHC